MSKKPTIKIFGQEFPDMTEEFKKVLYFDPKEVWQGASRNRIKTMPTIVLGTTGVGKSTFLEWNGQFIEQWYKDFGILSTYTNQVSLTEFLTYSLKIVSDETMRKAFGFKDMPSVFKFSFDDATSVEVKPREIKQFFSMRHIIQDELNVTEGIIYTEFVTHDWYSLSKIFRRYAENLVVLSVPPLDVYSRRHLASLLGDEAMKVMQAIYKKAMKEDKYKGKGMIKLPFVPDDYETDVGMIMFKPVDNSLPIQIKYGSSSNVTADIEKRILYIPKEDSIAENEEDAQARLEKEKRMNNARVKKHRAKQKKLLAKLDKNVKSVPITIMEAKPA
jgi:hypothetical protein